MRGLALDGDRRAGEQAGGRVDDQLVADLKAVRDQRLVANLGHRDVAPLCDAGVAGHPDRLLAAAVVSPLTLPRRSL